MSWRVKFVVELEVAGKEPKTRAEEWLVEETLREWVRSRLAKGCRTDVTAEVTFGPGPVHNFEGRPVRAALVEVRDIDVVQDCIWIEELMDECVPVEEAFARLRDRKGNTPAGPSGE
jgi:hypothetical protein